jgi:hypothetical protein
MFARSPRSRRLFRSSRLDRAQAPAPTRSSTGCSSPTRFRSAATAPEAGAESGRAPPPQPFPAPSMCDKLCQDFAFLRGKMCYHCQRVVGLSL